MKRQVAVLALFLLLTCGVAVKLEAGTWGRGRLLRRATAAVLVIPCRMVYRFLKRESVQNHRRR